ncbi:CueP family metal-binding protein [Nocardioides sp. 31GB23]|uniref:CueP family metal-binding protein n=1 Tax=Nocardioides sp. 31GB23 TaxID=3156065 RepID=UPI0032AF3A29
MSTPARARLSVAAAVVACGLLLAGCASGPEAQPSSSSSASSAAAAVLADHDLAGLEAPEVIERLDTMALADRPGDLMASVQPDAVVVTDDQGREARLPMPEDQVYVSVAPYVDQTHECHFHSLTTCVGELGDERVDVTLTTADGEVLVDETRRTYDNGFVGLWVPRDLDATLTITHDGRTGTAPITTRNPDDPTCVTTLQLT